MRDLTEGQVGLLLAAVARGEADLAGLPCGGAAEVARVARAAKGTRHLLRALSVRARGLMASPFPEWLHPSWVDQALRGEDPRMGPLIRGTSELGRHLARVVARDLGLPVPAPEAWVAEGVVRRMGVVLLARAARAMGREGARELLNRLGQPQSALVLRAMREQPAGGRAVLARALRALRSSCLSDDLVALAGLMVLADLLRPHQVRAAALALPWELGSLLERFGGEGQGELDILQTVLRESHGENHQGGGGGVEGAGREHR